MPLPPYVREAINSYISSHLPGEEWWANYFSFVRDRQLATRLADEFYTIRHIYKLLEGLSAEDRLKVAQIRLQVLSYSSIYEAVIHHVLFDLLPDTTEVRSLMQSAALREYSVPKSMRSCFENLHHDGRRIIPSFLATTTVPSSKVRFDRKVTCVQQLGLLQNDLCDELVRLYEARNSIHLHAELRKNLQWDLSTSEVAYRRLKPFREQIIAGLHRRRLCPCQECVGLVE